MLSPQPDILQHAHEGDVVFPSYREHDPIDARVGRRSLAATAPAATPTTRSEEHTLNSSH
jgi:hypothetical protein